MVLHRNWILDLFFFCRFILHQDANIFFPGAGEITGYYQVTSNVQPYTDHSHTNTLQLVDQDIAHDNERIFKQQKIENNFRLPHIKNILNK